MKRILTNRAIADELVRRGLAPANCASAGITIAADGGAVRIVFEIFVDTGMLAQIAAVLAAVAERETELDSKGERTADG